MIGMDIMPAATHLTCSMLSSAHPGEKFGKTNIYTMPYGIEGGKTHIGSLDLLDADQAYSLFATGAEAMGGQESDVSHEYAVSVKNQSCDLIIMNPPFTRPTGQEGKKLGIPVPSFAGFSTSKDEQRAMSRKLKKIKADFGDGKAGLASNFMDLGHRKLNDGGVLALVLPFTLITGKAWEKARRMLECHYSDIHIVSIATTGSKASAFSADTGIAECLVVATKEPRNSPAKYSNLRARPASILEAHHAARSMKYIEGSTSEGGLAGVRSLDLVHVVREFSQTGSLLLPHRAKAVDIPIVPLGKVAKRGPYHMQLMVRYHGAFDIRPVHQGEMPTYPALWKHNAKRECKLVVEPDTCGEPIDRNRGIETWQRAASRLHSNRDFRLNSQSLAMCLTPQKCLGGRAWPSILPHDERHEIPLLLWGNSTLGLLLWWWKGTRQQSGRSIITISALPELPVLDLRALTKDQLKHCHDIFIRFCGQEIPARE